MKRIKSGVFSRGLALAKLSATAGAKAALHKATGGSLDRLVFQQVELLTRELGQLKGSLMKVGQMLSMYGEHFLPPEANRLLKSLQSQSPALDWPAIEKQLLRQLGPEKLVLLEIDHDALACASLGQVHRAIRKSDGQRLALKIQYPGVDRAIDSDIRSLRSLLSMARLIPKGPKYDELFREVKTMLKQEVDYGKELESTEFFCRSLQGDPRFVVPRVFPEFSNSRILATSFEEGLPVDSEEVRALPQDRRDALGLAAMEIYFRELFEFRLVQTDPHFGNYRVRLGQKEKGGPDLLVLLDFGAVRKVPLSFLNPYRKMVRASLVEDREGIVSAAREIGFLREEDDGDLTDQFVDLCLMITEPFAANEYDWATSDLPKRVAKHVGKMVLAFKMRVPPREVVFLDRKMGGMFIFLQVLRVKVGSRDLLNQHLSCPQERVN